MVGQQVRLCWGDFARGRLGMRLSCRVETKCLWCSILDKQLIVDLKRNMNPQRPVVSTLWSLFWISSFIIIKHFSCASLVLMRYATDYAPTCMSFHTSIFLRGRQTFAAHHDHAELPSPSSERKRIEHFSLTRVSMGLKRREDLKFHSLKAETLCWGGVSECLGRWTCNLVVSDSSPPPCYSLDWFSVAPSITPRLRWVNSQLVFLIPVGVFKHFILVV